MSPPEIPSSDALGNTRVLAILEQIRDQVRLGNGFASRTAANTGNIANNIIRIRKDIADIRNGETGSKPSADTLTPVERQQVDETKRRIRALRQKNPHYPLLAVSRSVRRDFATRGICGGYKTDLALNSRVSRELKREDAGLPPF